MTIIRSNAVRNKVMEGLADARGGGAKLVLRTLDNTATINTGVELVTLLCDTTAWGTATDGVLSSNTIGDGTAIADGEIGHYELISSTGELLESGTVKQDGTGDISIINATVVAGQKVTGGVWTDTAGFAAPA